MPDRYADALGKQLFAWSGWVFTVGGAVGSFVVGREYAWVGWLAVAAGMLAVTMHGYAQHRRAQELEAENRRLAEELRTAEGRSQDTADAVVQQVRAAVETAALADWTARIVTLADYVTRMRGFAAAAAAARRIEPRSFLARAGQLYAVAKVPAAAAGWVRVRDRFILVRDVGGLRTEAAVLTVIEPPDPADGRVQFRVTTVLSDDLAHLERLAAAAGGVRGLTGYTVRPACDPDWYAGLESGTIAEAVARLAGGYERDQRDGT